MYVYLSDKMFTLCAYHAAIATMDNALMSGSCMLTLLMKCIRCVYIILP